MELKREFHQKELPPKSRLFLVVGFHVNLFSYPLVLWIGETTN